MRLMGIFETAIFRANLQRRALKQIGCKPDVSNRVSRWGFAFELYFAPVNLVTLEGERVLDSNRRE